MNEQLKVLPVTYSVDIWLHYCIFANKHIWKSRHCKKYDCNNGSSHVFLERFDGNALLKSFSDVKSHGFEATRSGLNLKEFYRKENMGCRVAGRGRRAHHVNARKI
ncbi:hypothetical protein COP2_005982 [Malus domestica]